MRPPRLHARVQRRRRCYATIAASPSVSTFGDNSPCRRFVSSSLCRPPTTTHPAVKRRKSGERNTSSSWVWPSFPFPSPACTLLVTDPFVYGRMLVNTWRRAEQGTSSRFGTKKTSRASKRIRTRPDRVINVLFNASDDVVCGASRQCIQSDPICTHSARLGDRPMVPSGTLNKTFQDCTLYNCNPAHCLSSFLSSRRNCSIYPRHPIRQMHWARRAPSRARKRSASFIPLFTGVAVTRSLFSGIRKAAEMLTFVFSESGMESMNSWEGLKDRDGWRDESGEWCFLGSINSQCNRIHT